MPKQDLKRFGSRYYNSSFLIPIEQNVSNKEHIFDKKMVRRTLSSSKEN
ncbi:hypothetical protein LEP1GSC195_3192 [Leptospira wolbachii serovar Codice str. CDC]|uniref:Uncharacterized protein n=1 Tax=Leptospira wolbachii serovar Codice str. CDC TaxID=1218599 RepID=R9A4S5_9LEPT|nr:hypothetical protein LEP1GSC195_3192 [Leptospira wolbachii serovar Codice str. CDC]